MDAYILHYKYRRIVNKTAFHGIFLKKREKSPLASRVLTKKQAKNHPFSPAEALKTAKNAYNLCRVYKTKRNIRAKILQRRGAK